jgi:hypothetical protein
MNKIAQISLAVFGATLAYSLLTGGSSNAESAVVLTEPKATPQPSPKRLPTIGDNVYMNELSKVNDVAMYTALPASELQAKFPYTILIKNTGRTKLPLMVMDIAKSRYTATPVEYIRVKIPTGESYWIESKFLTTQKP